MRSTDPCRVTIGREMCPFPSYKLFKHMLYYHRMRGSPNDNFRSIDLLLKCTFENSNYQIFV